jgi:phosphatidate cytidylyltransferase
MRGALWVRVVSTIVVAPIVVLLVWAGGPWLCVGLAGFYLLGAHEWSRICEEGGSIPVSWLNFFGGLPILYLGFSGHLTLLWPVLATLLAVNLVIPPFIGLSGGTVGMDLFGQVYIALPLAFLELLRAHGFLPAAVALFLVWGSDIGAYFIGSALGRHPLSPRLSPKKSWEGLIGGILFAGLIGVLLIPPWLHRDPLFGLGVGLAAGLLSSIGDLGESAIKRWANAKDSGRFMPGHGGLLDRIDSLLFALPALYYLLR